MKIKSLLLGSAAAMMAVSTAQAADIIIPEPEVVEYVRVCDAAGAGYFYIPGSETCLRIGGYVRYDVGFGELNGATHVQVDANGNVVFDAAGNPLNSDETWRTRARAELEFDTWTDTELGVLRTAVTLRFQHDTNDVGVVSVRGNPAATPAIAPVVPTIGYETVNELGIRAAYIDLAGLRIGKDESYFTQFTGYGGAVINDTTAGGYGPFDTNLIAYTFDSGAFSATMSLEQGDETVTVGQTIRGDRDGDGDLDYVAISDAPAGWGIDDYVPHIVAGAGYDAGAFQVRGVFGYDTRDGANQGGWSGKIRGDVDFDPFSAFVMLMYGENSSAYTTWRNGPVGAETFSVIGGASFAFTDAATFNTQVQWAEANGLASDEWAVAANINYEIVDDFIVRPELVYHNTTAGNDVFGGTLRFQRSF